MASWRALLEEAFKDTGDSIDSITSTLSSHQMNREFNSGYGGSEGYPFTAWSDNWVYFPAVYDGLEWVAWVPRNPCNIATTHIGGE